jgi:hypothetical protein
VFMHKLEIVDALCHAVYWTDIEENMSDGEMRIENTRTRMGNKKEINVHCRVVYVPVACCSSTPSVNCSSKMKN